MKIFDIRPTIQLQTWECNSGDYLPRCATKSGTSLLLLWGNIMFPFLVLTSNPRKQRISNTMHAYWAYWAYTSCSTFPKALVSSARLHGITYRKGTTLQHSLSFCGTEIHNGEKHIYFVMSLILLGDDSVSEILIASIFKANLKCLLHNLPLHAILTHILIYCSTEMLLKTYFRIYTLWQKQKHQTELLLTLN
jgi:hypothetical protein